MTKRPPPEDEKPSLRDKIIGLGERSVRKSYYPQLHQQLGELEEARKELAESQARYRSLVENINDVIFSLDTGGTVTYISPAIRSLSGFAPDEIVGRSFEAFIHSDDLADLRAQFQRVLAGQSKPQEFRIQDKDGGFSHVRSSARLLVEDGRVVGVTGVMSDITERKRAEEELRKSEKQLSDILDGSPIPQFVIGKDHKIIRWNKALEAYSGVKARDMVGTDRQWWPFYGEKRPTMADLLVDTCVTEISQWYAGKYARSKLLAGAYEAMDFFPSIGPNGSWMYFTASMITDSNGEVVGAVETLEDVTERKRAEEELERHRLHLEELVATRTRELAQARDAAEAANRSKSAFLANMSHELRTPLNAILGFAQIMERDERIPEDQRANLRTINGSGHHLLSLINDVLEISRIEAGRSTLQSAVFDLPGMLVSLREFVELRAHDKGLILHMTLSPDLPRFIRSDAGKLRQILLNLLSNAVKYTIRGEIEFQASVETANQPTLLQFTVRDTGVGISAEDLEKIFQPFFQAEYGAALGEGTGLGLTISREFAHLLGGSLTAESELQRGSIFRLVVPVETAMAPVETEPARGAVLGLMPGQPPVRVLIAEDDANSRTLLEQILTQAGFEVQAVNNGEQAVQAFLAWAPHFICMDMRMPVMDGYAATRRIRTLAGGHEVKIVALTASAFREEHGAIVAAGCDDVLLKPLERDQLFAVMEQLLGVRYRYADHLVVPIQAGAEGTDLSSLPASLREELCEAARLLDMEATKQAIDRIRTIDGPLANELEGLMRAYRYDQIFVLCNGP
jgi:PAS domain S-box-containing protein